MFRIIAPPWWTCRYFRGLFLDQQLSNDIPLFLILLLFKKLSVAADILRVNEALHGVYP